MKIIIDERGGTRAEDALFVANAACWGDSNKVRVDFEGNRERVDYVLLSFRRSDGYYIRDKVCEEITDAETGTKHWEYEITDTDGVLWLPGPLEVSAQLKHENIINGVKIGEETVAGVSAVAQVQRNIGIYTQTEYDSAKEIVDEVLMPLKRDISRLNTMITSGMAVGYYTLTIMSHEWTTVSAQLNKYTVAHDTHKLKNPRLDASLIESTDGISAYENGVLQFKVLLNDDVVVYTDKKVNCKIIIKGE